MRWKTRVVQESGPALPGVPHRVYSYAPQTDAYLSVKNCQNRANSHIQISVAFNFTRHFNIQMHSF